MSRSRRPDSYRTPSAASSSSRFSSYAPQDGTPPLRLKPLDTSTQQRTVRAAIKWAKSMETQAQSEGSPLSEAQRSLASRMGVEQPDRVRVVVGSPPQPANPTLFVAMQKIGMVGSHVNGLTFGHSVFINDKSSDPFNTVLSHELRHVKQHEDLGSIDSFLSAYVDQTNTYGYQGSGFEQDAYGHQIAQ